MDRRIDVRASTTIDEAMMRAAIIERPAILDLNVKESERRPAHDALALLFGWVIEHAFTATRIAAVERVRTNTLSKTSPILRLD